MTVDFFYDNLDIVGDVPVLVAARLQLLATEAGGRKGPFFKNYRPNHNFGDADNHLMFIGQIELLDRESMNPGESCEVQVRFLDARGLREHLLPGRVWRVQEGMRLVGTAEILRICE